MESSRPEAYEDLDGEHAEPTLRVKLWMAEAQRAVEPRSPEALAKLQAPDFIYKYCIYNVIIVYYCYYISNDPIYYI